MTDFEVDHYIKLEGTNYDRRRKLTTQDVSKIKRDYEKGTSISKLATTYGVSYITIKYHVDSDFKQELNERRNGYAHSDYDWVAAREDRIAYKRSIVSRG